MIKWRGRKGDREVVCFILESGNLDRLREGKPIYIFGEEINIEYDIIIDYSPDTAATMREFKETGLIGENTIVHDTHERKKQ